MPTTTLAAEQIGSTTIESWRAILDARPDLASPFLRPEFAQMAAAAGADVHVTVMRRGTEVEAILPFQRRSRLPLGDPVSGDFADYQALIAPPGSEASLERAVSAAGLGVWRFTNLLDPDGREQRWVEDAETSWVIDVSAGFAAYDAWAAARSRQYKRLKRKERRLAEEVGPLRFELEPPDMQLVDHVIAAKRRQYALTGVPDPLADDYSRRLIRMLAHARRPEFGGLAATLRAGGRLVAVDLGMRTHEVFHSWLPIMDHDLKPYSPGHILLKKTVEAASERGMTAIDLGWGDSAYKERFANRTVRVHRGAVRTPSVVGTTWGAGAAVADWVRGGPLHGPARAIRRAVATATQGAP